MRWFVLAIIFLSSGCASVRPTEETAIIHNHLFEIPLIYGDSVFVEMVDGEFVERSLGYVEVREGPHEVRVAYVTCMFPIAIVTCFFDLGASELEFVAIGGKEYEVRRRDNQAWIQEVGTKVIASSPKSDT